MHADFLRDFRGDTIHPSTMQVMHELGWLDEFLKLPHGKVAQLGVIFAGTPLQLVDFSHLPVAAPYIAMMQRRSRIDRARESGHGRSRPGMMSNR